MQLDQTVHNAIVDCTQIAFLNTTLSTLDLGLETLGNFLIKHQWKKTGSLVKNAGSIVRFGIFAWSAHEQGLVETSAAVVSGAVMQTVIENTGIELVNQLGKK